MPEVKFFEVRDEGTRIPVMVVEYVGVNDKEKAMLEFVGLGEGNPYTVQVTMLTTCETQRDPYKWEDGRTMRHAHKYIRENWDILMSGEVVDVQYILGETNVIKESQFK